MQQAIQSPTLVKESIILKWYNRYEYLATKYAHQIFESRKIGFDYEDLLQEFKMKIYTSIIAYSRKWEKWKLTGKYKPIHVEMYIKSALVNLTKDFMKQISTTEYKTVSVEQDGFDYGLLTSMESHIVINSSYCKCEINGVDLLEGLTDMESRCFMLFLRGHTIGKLNKIFKCRFQANKIIRRQVEFLQTKKSELLENKTYQFMHYVTEHSDMN